MFSRLSGPIIEKNPPFIVIDVHGIGFEVEVSMQTYYQLPELGQRVSLYIQAYYREDSQQLFGFQEKQEKTIFNQLIKVNGIGVKTALAILSVLDIPELAQAIETKNINRLASVPGIGKKTAERLALELKDKIEHHDNVKISPEIVNDNIEDIIQTLMALGYNRKEAQLAVKTVPSEVDISTGVKLALRKLTQ